MFNAGMIFDSSRRLIFGGPVITLGLTGKSLSSVKVRVNEAHLEVKRQFSVRNHVLIHDQSPHKWWSTLKSSVFHLNSSLPPLVGGGGGLVCESGGKADLF